MPPQNPSPITPSLPGAVSLFGQAWGIYKTRLLTLLGIMAIPVIISAGFFMISAVSGILTISFLLSKMMAGGLILIIVTAIFILLGGVITQSWSQTTLLFAIRDSNQKISIIESYRKGWHKILSYWWVTFLAGIITTGGILLLIVPGIIFAVWFSLAVYVMITENIGGMNALLKSREYVRGYWGSVLWRLLFLALFSLILYFVPAFLLNLLKTSIASSIYSFAISLFLPPFAAIYSFLIYGHLKNIKKNLVFDSKGSTKVAFIFTGIIGLLIIPAISFFTIYKGISGLKLNQTKAQDAGRQLEISQIRSGLQLFYYDNGFYPSTLNELVPKYLPEAPSDPQTNQPYLYQLMPENSDYNLCVKYESSKSQKCFNSKSQ